MISLNQEATYVNNYVMMKEYFLSYDVREALNKINYYIRKGMSKKMAVHHVYIYYKFQRKLKIEKLFLDRQYSARQARIRNGQVDFERWKKELREKACGIRLPFCACGCRERVTKKGNKYIKGHNRRCITQEEKNNNAANMREKKRLKKERVNVIDLEKRRRFL